MSIKGKNVIPKRRILLASIGVLLFSTLFSSTLTFLATFQGFTKGYLTGGDDQAVIFSKKARTFFTGILPQQMADNLYNIKGVEWTSPEIITPIVLKDRPVTLRGLTQLYCGYLFKDTIDGPPSDEECLVGKIAAEKHGLTRGDKILIRSTRRNSLKELIVKDVYYTGTPIDYEVVGTIETTRFIAGLKQGAVSLIRIDYNEDVIDENTIRDIITTTHTLKVEVTTNSSTKIQVRIYSEGKRVAKKNVETPGSLEFKLSFDDYTVEAGGEKKEVFLAQDKSIRFELDQVKPTLRVLVYDSQDWTPLSAAKVEASSEELSIKLQTSEEGIASFVLPQGKYHLNVEKNGFRKERDIELVEDSETIFRLGWIRLDIVLLNSTTHPVEGSNIYVTGVDGPQQAVSDGYGKAVFYLKPGVYRVEIPTGNGNITSTVELIDPVTIFPMQRTEEEVFNLAVNVAWANGSRIPGSEVIISNDSFEVSSHTDYKGETTILGLPSGEYSLVVSRLGYQHKETVKLDEDETIPVTLPTPLIPREELIGYWVKYAPEDLMLESVDVIVESGMRLLIDIVKGVIISLILIVLLTVAVGSREVVSTAIEESHGAVGVLRALGAEYSQVFSMVTGRLVLNSFIVGGLGYILGFGILYLSAYKSLITLGGYTLFPSFNPTVFLSTVGVTFLITLTSSHISLRRLYYTPPTNLLKGLQRRELLRLPNIRTLYLTLVAFLIPLLVRAVPELLMYPHPVGFDVIASYIPTLRALKEGVGPLVYIVEHRPLFWALTSIPYPLTGEAPLKFLQILMHGLLGVASFMYANTVFKSRWKALGASLLSTLYFIPLRVSWDLLANQMGIIFVFLSLLLLGRSKDGWGTTLITLICFTSTIYIHEGASVILFVAAIPQALHLIWKQRDRAYGKYALIILPTLTLFIYRIITLGIPLTGGIMGRIWYPELEAEEVTESVLYFFAYCNLPLIPLALLGLRSKTETIPLKSWFLGCALAALLPSISPWRAFPLWRRWTFMASYPLCFFAIDGLDWFKRYSMRLSPFKRGLDLRIPVTILAALVIGSISYGFIAMPPEDPYPYFDFYGTKHSWVLNRVPPSMQYNTLPYFQIGDTIENIRWLNDNTDGRGVLLADILLRGYASIYLDEEKLFWYDTGYKPYQNPDWVEGFRGRIKTFEDQGLEIYLISGLGGAEGFNVIHREGNIAIYHYVGVTQES